MHRTYVALPALAAVLAIGLAAGAAAQDKQLYRYTDADGKVVYSDKVPPSSAKNVQPKKITANVIETNELPLAAQVASERYPVTLYTFDCGDLCRNAETLLNRRGIPFTAVNVSDPQGAAKLLALTGEKYAPVLQVGEKMVAKGYVESRWQALLDEAGYPKTPTPRRTPAKNAPADAAARADAAPAAPPVTTAAKPEGGYPKD